MFRISNPLERFPGELFALGVGVVVASAIFISPWAALAACLLLAAGQAYLVGRAYSRREAALEELHETRDREAALRADLTRLRGRIPYEDPDTGVGTRKQLEVSWTKQVARQRRWGEPFALAVLEFSDAFRPEKLLSPGAAATTARALLDLARTEDIICRLDNHTFAALLAGAGTDGARAFVDRVRMGLSAEPQRAEDGIDSYLTVQAGVAEASDSQRSLVDLLAAADADMAVFRHEYGQDRAAFEADLPRAG